MHAEHADFVGWSLQRLGVRESDLGDLFQEVFVVVHRRLATFDGSSPMPAWLFGICKRVVAAHRRRGYRRWETVVTNPPEESSEGIHPNPEEVALARQRSEKLAAILGELDRDKRAVLVMFEIEESSCEEISLALGVPVGTVYSRLHAARKAFQKALARDSARNARGDRG